MTLRTFSKRVLTRPALHVAPRLLGARLVRETSAGLSAGIIVETEAYNQDDPASHCYRGKTRRNRHMFEAGGLAYVYFTYGMHFCVNVVTGPPGRGEAVLIRALEPVAGLTLMAARRDVDLPRGTERGLRRAARHQRRIQKALWSLSSGPARLTRALAIDRELDGTDLLEENGPLRLVAPRKYAARSRIVRATRIGIRKATEKRWRFYLRGNPFVSVT